MATDNLNVHREPWRCGCERRKPLPYRGEPWTQGKRCGSRPDMKEQSAAGVSRSASDPLSGLGGDIGEERLPLCAHLVEERRPVPSEVRHYRIKHIACTRRRRPERRHVAIDGQGEIHGSHSPLPLRRRLGPSLEIWIVHQVLNRRTGGDLPNAPSRQTHGGAEQSPAPYAIIRLSWRNTPRTACRPQAPRA